MLKDMATWTTPDGEVWDLTGDLNLPGVSTLNGVAGIGAAPRSVSRRSLATGGTTSRWSHMEERLIAWPLEVHTLGDPAAFLDLWRQIIRAFTVTTPPAGTPRPGVLRITRADASWREITCVYLGGFEQTDPEGQGFDRNAAVISLVASDPTWYGEESTIVVPFEHQVARNYLNPYETVGASTAEGSQSVEIFGDIDALPVWILTGPATSFTVTLPNGGGFTFLGTLLAGESVVIDVGASTVVDNTGVNRIQDLDWPDSDLMPLPVGMVTIVVAIGGASTGAGVQLAYRPRWESA